MRRLIILCMSFVVLNMLYYIMWYTVTWPMPSKWKDVHIGMTRLEIHQMFPDVLKDNFVYKDDIVPDESISKYQSRYQWIMLVTYDKGRDIPKGLESIDREIWVNDKVISVNYYTNIEWQIGLVPPEIRRTTDMSNLDW